MSIMEDVKVLLNIDSHDLDTKLSIIIRNAERQVLSYLDSVETVPDELSYIVSELAVARFNRLGNEGMSSYTQDGESVTYGDDMKPYMSDINAWNASHTDSKKDKVRFL